MKTADKELQLFGGWMEQWYRRKKERKKENREKRTSTDLIERVTRVLPG